MKNSTRTFNLNVIGVFSVFSVFFVVPLAKMCTTQMTVYIVADESNCVRTTQTTAKPSFILFVYIQTLSTKINQIFGWENLFSLKS